jgi:hypothetical protein
MSRAREAPPFQPLKTSATNGNHPGDQLRTHNLDAKIVTVTPALAKEWLAQNIGNRHEKPFKIEQYKRDMQNGRWDLTGEPIIFDTNGHLRNGQNRCRACIVSGASFVTLVIWGVRSEAFKNMDRGAQRTAADVRGIQSEDNSSILAAACGYLSRHERGIALAQGGKSAATVEETIEVLERHPDLRQSMQWASGARRIGIEPSLAVYLHYRMSKLDNEDADEFFSRLVSGAELGEGHPILILRNTMLATRANQKEKLKVAWKVAYAFKAWNAWRTGKTIRFLRYNPSTEEFPELR